MPINQVLSLIPDDAILGTLKVENLKELIKKINVAILENDIDIEKLSVNSTGSQLKNAVGLLSQEVADEILEEYFLGKDADSSDKEEKLEEIEVEERRWKLKALKFVTVSLFAVLGLMLLLVAYVSIKSGGLPESNLASGVLTNVFEIIKIIIGSGT